MSKQKMQAARELIQKKDYARAREILKTVDHPTAREWEARLDALEKRPARTMPMQSSAVDQSAARRKPQAPAAAMEMQGRQPEAEKSSGMSVRRLLVIFVLVVLVVVAAVVVFIILPNSRQQPQQVLVAQQMPIVDMTEEATDMVEPTDEVAAPASTMSAGRPEKLPADFPFPPGGFMLVSDQSLGDTVLISVTNAMSLEQTADFFRTELTSQGYDFAVDSDTILSFLGADWQGSVRLSADGPNGETRITIELKPTQFLSLNDAATAAVSQPASPETRFDDPADAARAFMAAVATQDYTTALSLVCETMRPVMDEAILRAFQPSTPGGVADFSMVEYTVISQQGMTADVQLSGQFSLTMTANNSQRMIDMPETTFTLLNENGWKICPVN